MRYRRVVGSQEGRSLSSVRWEDKRPHSQDNEVSVNEVGDDDQVEEG